MPYKPLFVETDMKIKYEFTAQELADALIYWLENQQGCDIPSNAKVSFCGSPKFPYTIGKWFGEGIAVRLECERDG